MDGGPRRGTPSRRLLQAAGVPAAVASVHPSWSPTSSCGVAASSASWSGRRSAPTHFTGPIVGLHTDPGRDRATGASYGQHTEDVLRDLLGLGDDEIAALHAAGVTSTEPLAQDWR